jgi:hypothetical protein
MPHMWEDAAAKMEAVSLAIQGVKSGSGPEFWSVMECAQVLRSSSLLASRPPLYIVTIHYSHVIHDCCVECPEDHGKTIRHFRLTN